jgi:hypothetical protein
MSLYDEIVKVYPELNNQTEIFQTQIRLADDSDNKGEYVVKWEYNKPLPNGLKIGK